MNRYTLDPGENHDDLVDVVLRDNFASAIMVGDVPLPTNDLELLALFVDDADDAGNDLLDALFQAKADLTIRGHTYLWQEYAHLINEDCNRILQVDGKHYLLLTETLGMEVVRDGDDWQPSPDYPMRTVTKGDFVAHVTASKLHAITEKVRAAKPDLAI